MAKASVNGTGTARRFWVATHRYLGLFSLAFLALASITGVLLCFRAPLDRTLNPDLFRLADPAARVEPFAAATALAKSRPELVVAGFALHPGPGRALQVDVEPRSAGRPLGYDQAFVGPGGKLLGVRQTRPGWDRRHLMQGVYLFHYTLLTGNPGRWLMGAVAAAWLTSNLVGLYLTFPRRAPWLHEWLRDWTIRPSRSLARLLLDVHRASGLWVLIGVTVLAYTSVGMNFFDEAFTPAVNRLWPPRPSPFDQPLTKTPAAPTVGFETAVATARVESARRSPVLVPAKTAYDPERGLYSVMLTRSGREGYRSLGPVYVHVDAASGRIVYEDNPYTDSFGRKLSRSLFPLHSGQIAGPIGVAVIVLLGLATLEISVTGAYLWLKRRPGRVQARKAQRAGAARPRAAE